MNINGNKSTINSNGATINVSVNTTNSTTIDLSGITTFGELKNALPSTGITRVPGVKQLKKKASVLLRKVTETGSIEIYDNGFFTYEEFEKVTVFGVDRCECPELYSYNGRKERGGKEYVGKERGRKMEDFSEYPWDLILVSAGEARLYHNADSREEYQSEISMDAPESENNIALSVKPEHEIREEEEAAAKWRAERLKRLRKSMEKLTDRQREVVILYYVNKMTQMQIAEKLGIRQQSVLDFLGAARKKMQKNF